MNDRTLRILMQIRADIAELSKLHSGLDTTKTKLKETSAAGQALFAGFAAGAALGAFQAVISAITQIPRAFASAVSEGVRFNATLETSKLGIAAIIKQFDTTGKFQNFDDALAESGKAIDLLKRKALESPATFEQLVQAFQGVSGAASAANIPIKQQVDLVVLMSQALAGLGIRSEQILQESRALLTGNITEDALAARLLQITKAQIDNAKAQGQLFEFLSGKLSAFKEAGVRGMDSYTTQVANLGDALQQLKGIATAGIFESLKEGLRGINEELNKDETREKAAAWGASIAEAMQRAVEALNEFIEQRKKNQAFLEEFDKNFSFGIFDSPARPASLPQITAGDLAAAREFSKVAEERRQTIIATIQAATSEEAKLSALKDLDEQRARIATRLQDTNAVIRHDAEIEAQLLQHIRANFNDIAGSANDVAAAVKLTTEQLEKMIAQTQALQSFRAETSSIFAKARGDSSGAFEIELEEKRIALQREFMEKRNMSALEAAREVAPRIQALREEFVAQEAIKTAKQSGAASDRESRDLIREQRDVLRDLQSQRSAIESNPFLTTDQKNSLMIPILRDEAEQLRITGDAYAAYRKEQEALSLSFSGSIQAGLVTWVNSLGTAAQAITSILTGTLNTAIAATSQAITGLILGTKTWAQAFAQAGASIIQNIIQVVLQFIAGQVAMFLIRQVFGQQEKTIANKAAAQSAAAWAPAATSASIASYGAAAGFGVAAYIAALGLGTAAAVGASSAGGFESGGYTGDIGAKQVAGIVHGREYVFDAPATSRLGVGFLERLRRGEISLPIRGYESGGYVTPVSSSSAVSGRPNGESGMQVKFAFFDERADAKTWLNSDEGEKWLVDVANRNSHRIA